MESMVSPRIIAATFVVLLIGALSLVGIFAVAWIGPTLAHGQHTEHASGIIVDVGPGRNFVLQTAEEQKIGFQCNAQCRGSLRHILRHLKERANTDVYYVREADNTLLVVDVD